ncbi:hypothetical protein CNECB9_10016 [Cupriavidus necator]|uniref:Uncharacterized protein n=1 Tax=Cupriavidus necator TaxID=106590 RepID=A0A1K0I7Z1_CUPNE|nr:hypothetical protein CNECB9_10016 [Cupriavidus necator]
MQRHNCHTTQRPVVRHCPQQPVGNCMCPEGHLYRTHPQAKSLFCLRFSPFPPPGKPHHSKGCAHKSTAFAQVVHRLILCG